MPEASLTPHGDGLSVCFEDLEASWQQKWPFSVDEAGIGQYVFRAHARLVSKTLDCFSRAASGMHGSVPRLPM